MNAVNFVLFGLGPPPWFVAVVWGGLALLVTVPSMLGGFVGLSWPMAVRANREGADTSSIPPRAIGWLFVQALALSVVLVPLAFMLFRTLGGTVFGAGVAGFVLNVFLARASVRRCETTAQQPSDQAGSENEGVHNE